MVESRPVSSLRASRSGEPAAAPRPAGGIPRWLRHAVRVLLHLACDAGAVTLAFRLAYELRFHAGWFLSAFPLPGEDPGWQPYIRILFALVPMWLGVFWYSCELYAHSALGLADRFLLILKGTMLASLVTLAGTLIYGRLEYSRLMLILACPLALALVSLSQLFVLRIDAWLALFEETSPLLVVGGGKIAEVVRDNLRERHPGVEIHEVESFDDPERVLEAARAAGAREIVLVRGASGRPEVLALAEACESEGIGFKMIPDLLELRLGEIQMDDSLGLPAYQIKHTSLTEANYAAKRAFDIAFSLGVLAACSLPLGFIALFIRLGSPGPVLYRQQRMGYKGRPFDAFKFRTMVADAESRIETVKAASGPQGGFFKAKDDPRVTPIGRLLRRFSLDEFPQFLNVLRGEMSVVGPRPLALTTGEMEELIREFGSTAKKRTNILPGITGLWQVSGRSDVSSEQRFALDMFYIEHWSLGLDLQIILRTIPAMLFGKGAY